MCKSTEMLKMISFRQMTGAMDLSIIKYVCDSCRCTSDAFGSVQTRRWITERQNVARSTEFIQSALRVTYFASILPSFWLTPGNKKSQSVFFHEKCLRSQLWRNKSSYTIIPSIQIHTPAASLLRVTLHRFLLLALYVMRATQGQPAKAWALANTLVKW